MICKGPNTHFVKAFPDLLGTKKVLYVNGNAQWCPEYPVSFSNASFWCSHILIFHLKLTTNNLVLCGAAEQNETGRPFSTYRGVGLSCAALLLNYQITWQQLILLSSFCTSVQSGSTYTWCTALHTEVREIKESYWGFQNERLLWFKHNFHISFITGTRNSLGLPASLFSWVEKHSTSQKRTKHRVLWGKVMTPQQGSSPGHPSILSPKGCGSQK